MTSLKTSIKTITYLSDIGCLEIQGASLLSKTHDMSKLPTGVEIRGRNIRIWFMFRGKRCRETLKGWEITNSNIKKAGNLRALIVHEINSGEFEYLRRFPQSSTGQKW
ncbi:hypothetical protein ESCOMMO073B3_11080 [Escherichia coli]